MGATAKEDERLTRDLESSRDEARACSGEEDHATRSDWDRRLSPELTPAAAEALAKLWLREAAPTWSEVADCTRIHSCTLADRNVTASATPESAINTPASQ
jgi:hypothetical protein